MKGIYILLLSSFLMLSSVSVSYSQCAMCRATVESNSKTGDKAIGRGLNAGILYLMAIPYVLVSVIGFLWYKNSKKNSKTNRSLAYTKGFDLEGNQGNSI